MGNALTFTRRAGMMLAALTAGLFTGVPVQAAALSLPALPAGCQYTRQTLNTIQGIFRVEPGTPLYGVVGPQQSPLLDVSLRCDGPLPAPLTLSLKGGSALNWQGPGRDILATGVRDTGIRLLMQGESTGGTCSPSGWLGAGNGEPACTLPAGGEGSRTLSLRVAAQVVKTGDDTPMKSTQALQPDRGGDIQLAVSGSLVPLLGSGAVAPQLVTPVTCEVEWVGDKQINFGNVKRTDKYNGYVTTGVKIGGRGNEIWVRCSPTDAVSGVYVEFSGDTSNEYMPSGPDSALKTNISDLFITVSDVDHDTQLFHFNNEKVKLLHLTADGTFMNAVHWHLMNYSKTGKQPDEAGVIRATATYTVSVE
ncbi:hypothetical protein M8Q70_003612 [Salmonella enterica]|nr:fimbrial protein [Salmonella enterica]EJE1296154.1 hypothetical protein [Salmonella enterica]EJF1559725.1 hypothetical protein [Salmonella enterica]EJF4886178.1 hypothetical protein [Salmonella enterica]